MLFNILFVLLVKFGCVNGACPDLPITDHLQYTCSDGFEAGSKCTYSCDRRHELHGGPYLFCTGSGWSEIHPLCTATTHLCPTITPPPKGHMSCNNVLVMGVICTFTCDRGFVLNSNMPLFCNSLRRWSGPVPDCITATCVKPTVENGDVDCSTSPAGSLCSVSCESGFYPSSTQPFTCIDTLITGTVPECQPDSCLPALNEISKSPVCTDENSPGSTCQVSCTYRGNAGKTKSFLCGDPGVRAGAGFWNGDVMECVGCGKGLLDIFILIDGSGSVGPTIFTEILQWTSQVVRKIGDLIDSGVAWFGLGMSGSQEATCPTTSSLSTFQVEMSLASTKLQLLQKKILELRQIGGCLHLGSAMAETVSSLALKGRPNVTPVIFLVVAGTSFDDFSGSVTMANAAGVQFIVVGFAGANGFLFLDVTADRRVIFNVPEVSLFSSATKQVVNALLKSDCPDLSMCGGETPNGDIACEQFPGKRRLYEEKCTATCDPDYELYGSVAAICGDLDEDGDVEWLSPKPGCKDIKCPPRPHPPVNALMTCTDSNNFLSVCYYYCSPTFFMLGFSQSSCGDPDSDGTGQWNARVPQCVPALLCNPVLSPPTNGSMDCDGTDAFGTRCLFSCDEGFELIGSGIVNCGKITANSEVEWSDVSPTCKSCETRVCKLDLVVVIDGSSSIKTHRFQIMKRWVVDVLGVYEGEIDEGRTWIGMIQYGGKSSFMCSFGGVFPEYRVEVELSQHTYTEIGRIVSDIGHLRGCTATGGAVTTAIQHFEAFGRGKDVIQAMLLVTDGLSNDKVAGSAETVRSKNIKLVVIGIGKFVADQLKKMSKSAIIVPSMDELHNVTLTVREEVKQQISKDFLK